MNSAKFTSPAGVTEAMSGADRSLIDATTFLQDACREARVEIATFYPAADAWQLVRRAGAGRKEIECPTAEFAPTLQCLAAEIRGGDALTHG